MGLLCRQLLSRLLKSACPEDLETANRLIKTTIKEVRRTLAPVQNIHLVVDIQELSLLRFCVRVIFKEQEKAEKASKLEYTLKEVESSTKELRDLLERQAISGTILELSDDVMVCLIIS